MFKKIKNILFFIIILIPSSIISQNCHQIIQQTLDNISNIHTTSFNLTAKERFFNEYKIEKAFYKIRNNPYSLYYKQIVPPTYAEVLINEKFVNEALVNPNSFPYFSLKMNPYGEKLREKQHHNLYQAGFIYIKNTLLHMKKKYQLSWADVCEYNGIFKIAGKECYKITLNNPHYKIENYTVPKNYTVQDLALNLNLCDIKILELNPKLKDIFKVLQKGTVIKVPTDYAKKTVLYIEKTSFLIIKIEVYDEVGLFEEYLFEDLKINPVFTNNEFDENNPAYGFK